MKRESKRFLEEDGYRIVNKVWSDEISGNPHIDKHMFMKILLDTPEILRCDSQEFDTLRVFQDGNYWVAESQARVYDPNYRRA
jgi:hypothetical protein